MIDVNIYFKSKLIGSRLGHAALRARDFLELVFASWQRKEILGTIANDQLATCLITNLCLPGRGFIDVGAHIGSIIAEVIKHDPSIKVYGIEPINEKMRNLKQKFPSVEFYEVALGEENKEVEFFINLKESGYSSLSISENNEHVKAISVSLKRLDDVIAAKNIDVIKIDVEGAELGVLRGGEVLIMNNRPLIMFESGPGEVLGFTKELLWQWLHDHGYEILVPNRVAHLGTGLTLDGFIESHLYPRRCTNYFAVPKERRTELMDRARLYLKL